MKKIVSPLLAFFFSTLPLLALAAQCPSSSGELCNPLAYTSLTDFLYKLLELVVQIGFPVIVLFIVYIGFKFITASASGKPEELAKVRSLFFWAIIGSMILLGGKALALAIQATVNQLG